MTRAFAFSFAVVVVAACAASTPPAKAPVPADVGAAFAPFKIISGDWTGTGGGHTGPSKGHFSLQPDLGGHVLVRRADNESAQGRHEDLMVIYASGTDQYRAVYFDGEGHTIQYAITAPTPSTLVFLSDEVAQGPRFRLTYTMDGDHGTVGFEIAPPGTTTFQMYVNGDLQRVK
jgi:hypothetical protein